jgi:hypothetical protein
VRETFGMLSAEERADGAWGTVEDAVAYVLLPLSSKVTSQHYVKVTDAHAIVVGTWGIAGTEWRRTHPAAAAQAGRQ